MSHIVRERLTISGIKLLRKRSDGEQLNFALVLVSVGVGCVTDLHSHSAAVKVESDGFLPGVLFNIHAVGHNESVDGSLPNDCDVDPCVVDHLLGLTLFHLDVVDQLFDHFSYAVLHIVKSTFGDSFLDHVAVANLISDRDCLGNTDRLDINTPVLMRHLSVEVSFNFVVDSSVELHERSSEICSLDRCSELEGLFFRVRTVTEETNNVATVFVKVEGGHVQHLLRDVVESLAERFVHVLFEFEIAHEVQAGVD